MNQTFTYPITPELQKSAAHQMFFTVHLKKKWIIIFAFFVLTGVCYLLADSNEPISYTPVAAFGALSFCLAIGWIKSYVVLMKQAQEYLKTVEGKENHLVIDEEGFEISNSNSSKRIKWDKVDGIEESRDFVMPLNGKFALICIPKDVIGDGVSELFRTRCGQHNKK